MRVLVTGATGLVGFEVVDQLRARPGVEVTGVSRPRSAGDGVVGWDIGATEPPPELHGEWDAIVHTAADTRWTMPAEEARRANVGTVEALAPLVSAHTRVVHVSTAYAVGLLGSTDSEALDDYRNTYEWSKAASERTARSLFPRVTIVRPPLVIGRRADGRAARFAGMYTILRGLTSSMVPAVVGVAEAGFEVVPVDELAELCVGAALEGEEGALLSIAAGEHAPSVEAALALMTGTLNEWRAERGIDEIQTPRLLTADSWNRFFRPFVEDELTPRQARVLDLLANFEPYLAGVELLRPTRAVPDVESCIAASVRFWADSHPRQAALTPRPWKAPAQT